MVKKILNRSEKQVKLQLQRLSEQNSAQVFSKIRVADALEIQNSGITSDEYTYSLKAHFDFLVCDEHEMPLFAVEFDGPSHRALRQQRNDRLKESLCEKLGLPLLRISSNHLTKRYRRMAPLEWLIETWFLSRAFDEAQAAGHIPWEEGFDPSFIIINSQGIGKAPRFPFDLSLKARGEIGKLYRAGKIVDPAPSWDVGRHKDRALHGFACIRIAENSGVWVKSGMRAQFFSEELLGTAG